MDENRKEPSLPATSIWAFYGHCNQLAVRFSCSNIGQGICRLIDRLFLTLADSERRTVQLQVWMDREVTSYHTAPLWWFYVLTKEMTEDLRILLREVTSGEAGWYVVGCMERKPLSAFPIFEYERGAFRVFFIRDDRRNEESTTFYPDFYYENGKVRFGVVELPRRLRYVAFTMGTRTSAGYEVRYADEVDPDFVYRLVRR
jgi:hypothetical protein